MIEKLLSLILLMTINVESKLRNLNPNEIQELKNAINEASEIMEIEAKNENVIICIGSPRSGKSTLINYLIGNKLIGVRDFKNNAISIVKADNSPGPEIGSGSTSKTTLPSRWSSINFPGLSLWDAPGFDDNRGPIQDITNAIYIYQLLQKVQSLKILLVIDINDILHDNIKPFLTVLNAVDNLFKDELNYYFRSISVIFSKVYTFHDVPIDMEFINDLLREKILSTTNMSISENLREFVRFLVLNNQHIGFFKKAKLGPITNEIDINIFQAIQNSKSTEKTILTKISPSISDESMLYLYEARESLSSTSSFIKLQEIVEQTLNYHSNRVQIIDKNNNDSLNNLQIIYNDLYNIKLKIHKTFNVSLDFHQKIEILQSIDPEIKSHIEKENLFEKAKFLEIIDKLLKLKESNIFDINLQSILNLSLIKLSESMISISLELGKITQGKSEELLENERIRHYYEREKLNTYLLDIQKLNEERKKYLYDTFGNFLKMAVTKVASWFLTRGASSLS
ncbi:uncharacterized protein LOC127287660 [Leptopilina boulardi]|uniref:uncharacterized protein LOC127287660 n=1 Tax=Leptopilina boulardi TaxID=63433 RepID=UPI0021F62DFA|nr:uncharacterized protein LOC127287660 [Leptopilina boulardi]